MNFSIQPCTISDLHTLQKIATQTFYETFHLLNTKEAMDSYLANAFHEITLTNELQHPQSYFYFIYRNEELAGYMKLNIGDAQTEPMGEKALEVQRIYILNSFSRLGLGRMLMQKALQVAETLNKQSVWLGVWEKNPHAIHFYEKLGFSQFDTHNFAMGNEQQTDFLYKYELS